jgi:hypothetical protein
LIDALVVSGRCTTWPEQAWVQRYSVPISLSDREAKSAIDLFGSLSAISFVPEAGAGDGSVLARSKMPGKARRMAWNSRE